MAGYFGKSMSNNAIRAYGNGEMPKSKWKKGDILQEIKQFYSDEEYKIIKSFSLETLTYWFLQHSSWHHTGKFYRRTNFYKTVIPSVSVDIMKNDDLIRRGMIEGVTKEELDEYLEHFNIKYVKFTNEEFSCNKYTSYKGKGIIAGKYCYIVEYEGEALLTVKRIDGTHFFYYKKDIHSRMPKDFDPKKTEHVLKKYSLGRFFPKPKGLDINPKDYIFSLNNLMIGDEDEDVRIIIEKVIEEFNKDLKKRRILNRAILYSADAVDLIQNLFAEEEFKKTSYYYELIILNTPTGSKYYSVLTSERWHAIRSIFGEKRFYTEYDCSYVYYGTKENIKKVDSGKYEKYNRVAVFDNTEEVLRIKPILEKLMEYMISENGHFYIFNSNNATKTYKELNGNYSIFSYQGLVAFIKDSDVENTAG